MDVHVLEGDRFQMRHVQRAHRGRVRGDGALVVSPVEIGVDVDA